MTEGSICFITRFTAASPKRRRGSLKKPSLYNQGSWNARCSTPPASTAQPNAITGGWKYGTRNTANTMNDTFSKTGVNAGTEKRLYVLRMLPTKDESEISRI